MMCVIRNRPFRRVGDTFRDAGVMQTAAEGGGEGHVSPVSYLFCRSSIQR